MGIISSTTTNIKISNGVPETIDSWQAVAHGRCSIIYVGLHERAKVVCYDVLSQTLPSGDS